MYFIGSHADIGGFGTSKRQQIALNWMVGQGFKDRLLPLLVSTGYILTLRASPYRNSYLEATMAEGDDTRTIDWNAVSVDTIAVAKDGGLSKVSDIQNTLNLVSSLAKATLAVAKEKQGN